ncbi:octaprenyl diphosphate synthase [Pelagibaculum spongiae]|uniref:Octaprenyl diphosphate synthase n=1 Tax=Pelagibaculum spongiae TaxID=2080658 RepID=A0A2V1H237_9GAMM|nr:octaprenyl diphosphate synthase [Pelagibaculum spongiae]PVZ70441.1 octaprenyl diphosphate synthase [Pelagibaculum spongiae]
MDFAQVLELIKEEKQQVDQLILDRLQSDVVLVNQVGHYIVNSGGKRLRPILVLLAANALAYKGRDHLELAAVVEFIHTATLLHDDVVDASDLRRGRETANALFGNEASVLVGDFLYSRAFQMMVSVKQMRVMEILSDATNIIAEGEVLQLLNCNEPDLSEADYLEVIRRKTAKLFEAATRLGAVLSGASQQQEDALAEYGNLLGTAFQIIDDVMDYSASAEEMGKNVGDDLAEGKTTLPLIQAMKTGSAEQAAVIRAAIEAGSLEQIDSVTNIIKETGALEYSKQRAQQLADEACAVISILPESNYRSALEALARIAVDRNK